MRDSFASAEEIGKFIAVLLSNHAAGAGFMTGSDVVIDGGEFRVGRKRCNVAELHYIDRVHFVLMTSLEMTFTKKSNMVTQNQDV
jgi:hypothetical protein